MEVDTGAVLQLSASQPTSPHSLLVSDLPWSPPTLHSVHTYRHCDAAVTDSPSTLWEERSQAFSTFYCQFNNSSRLHSCSNSCLPWTTWPFTNRWQETRWCYSCALGTWQMLSGILHVQTHLLTRTEQLQLVHWAQAEKPNRSVAVHVCANCYWDHWWPRRSVASSTLSRSLVAHLATTFAENEVQSVLWLDRLSFIRPKLHARYYERFFFSNILYSCLRRRRYPVTSTIPAFFFGVSTSEKSIKVAEIACSTSQIKMATRETPKQLRPTPVGLSCFGVSQNFQLSRNDQVIFLSLKIPLARLKDISKVVNWNRRPRKLFLFILYFFFQGA